MEDQHFDAIINELEPGDALVMNNTRVLPARLHGVKPDTGGHVELLLLKKILRAINGRFLLNLPNVSKREGRQLWRWTSSSDPNQKKAGTRRMYRRVFLPRNFP